MSGTFWGLRIGLVAAVVAVVALTTVAWASELVAGEAFHGTLMEFLFVALIGSFVGGLLGLICGATLGLVLGAARGERAARWVALAAAFGVGVPIYLKLFDSSPNGTGPNDVSVFVVVLLLSLIGYCSGVSFERMVISDANDMTDR